MYCQGLVAGQQAKKVLHERIYLDGLYFTWLYCQGPAKKVLHERVFGFTLLGCTARGRVRRSCTKESWI